MIGDIISMLLALIGTVCVIILTFYASKWYAKRLGPMAGGKYIKVVDRLAVSKTGSILIIDVTGEQYLVGVSDQNVQIIKELEDRIPLQSDHDIKNPGLPGINSIFRRWRGVD